MIICKRCQSPFDIHPHEEKLIDKISLNLITKYQVPKSSKIPLPKICPDCRQQRRLAMRNQRKLYKRECSLCRKSMICLYSADKTDSVYCPACYWSDKWSPVDYGQDFQEDKNFLDQLYQLWKAVPKLGLMILGENENSDYTNDNYKLKNSYLVFDGEQSIDCCYGETFSHLKNCFDFLSLQYSELCYECVNCNNCYQLFFSKFCNTCSSSWFLTDCVGCKNCFACANLSNKEFHIFNQPYSQQDYYQKLKSFNLASSSALQVMKSKVSEFFTTLPTKAIHGLRNENVSGDNLNNCKDCFQCFDCRDCRDCLYCTNILMGGTDCLDHNMWGENTSLVYNSAAVGAEAQNIACCYYVYSSASSVYYSLLCSRGVSDLFACVGLRHQNYCILNKKYSVTEYTKLLNKIISNLIEQDHWGEFFPSCFSDFGYNETVAQEFYPLTKEEAVAKGFKWSEYKNPEPKIETLLASKIPDSINELDLQILEKAICCEISGRLFRYSKLEYDFLKKFEIPLPRIHPDIRHLNRLNSRPRRKLIKNNCAKCNQEILTSFALNNPIRYCENCYQQEFRQ